MNAKKFSSRHIGPSQSDREAMLKEIGFSSLDELINNVVPADIRLKGDMNLESGMTEKQFGEHVADLASRNKLFNSYIGTGYYGTEVPAVIKRNVLENPGWYTAYTPYQAEIAQGRLEALLNFQTVVSDLTGLKIANASLLDEATAAAEAMIMFYNSRSRQATKAGFNRFFVSADCFPQTLDVLSVRAEPLGIDLVIGSCDDVELTEEFFGALVQYPDVAGSLKDLSAFSDKIHEVGGHLAVGTDLMSLLLVKAPTSFNADVAFGNTQRFGVPMGYGGPHAAFFAAKEEFKRHMPGRIIGVSEDSMGKPAYRMALQTREQHIKRDRATSNICTAQVLLGIMASMYAVYHGPEGLRDIAETIHRKTVLLASKLKEVGQLVNEDYPFFDTIQVQPVGVTITEIRELAEQNEINFNYANGSTVGISIDETTSLGDIHNILEVFTQLTAQEPAFVKSSDLQSHASSIPSGIAREIDYLQHSVFNSYHSETEMMRYIKSLENKDISLVHSMIALGSCTMKLNAASELYPISIPEFANIHPFAPIYQTKGYQMVFNELERMLCKITGFSSISFQPNSGAQGEYTGLMVIAAYHKSRGDLNRNIALIPSSAHGTNPASAVMAGMKVVVVKCDEKGNIDMDDLLAKTDEHKANLSCLMVTYPSTHGVYEETIQEVTKIIHDNGGQVYMDGANMNAQVGLTNPATIGADVCHLNLHKTFSIPHGGGGPGVGPIGVTKQLAPFLPGHALVRTGGAQAIKSVSAAPWGSSLILLISYGYCKMLGGDGMTESTKIAILNANYMRKRISKNYPILYTAKNGLVAHEMITDCREFKKTAGIEVTDIAKRLMDYGFHAPTVSFPVAGTLMIEPTESESKAELDRFCDSMDEIRNEIEDIAAGIMDSEDNMLKNSPHPVEMIVSDKWNHCYGREQAAYPLKHIRANKFWPAVGRVDNALGDRNLICTCPSIEEYETA
jgi:glycine dehydrogenase